MITGLGFFHAPAWIGVLVSYWTTYFHVKRGRSFTLGMELYSRRNVLVNATDRKKPTFYSVYQGTSVRCEKGTRLSSVVTLNGFICDCQEHEGECISNVTSYKSPHPWYTKGQPQFQWCVGTRMLAKLCVLVLQNAVNDNVHILVNCLKPVACILVA